MTTALATLHLYPNERPCGAEAALDDQVADADGTACAGDRARFRVTEPAREQKDELNSTTTDRRDDRAVLTVAAELLRRDSADEHVTDTALTLASIAAYDKDYGTRIRIGSRKGASRHRNSLGRARPATVEMRVAHLLRGQRFRVLARWWLGAWGRQFLHRESSGQIDLLFEISLSSHLLSEGPLGAFLVNLFAERHHVRLAQPPKGRKHRASRGRVLRQALAVPDNLGRRASSISHVFIGIVITRPRKGVVSALPEVWMQILHGVDVRRAPRWIWFDECFVTYRRSALGNPLTRLDPIDAELRELATKLFELGIALKLAAEQQLQHAGDVIEHPVRGTRNALEARVMLIPGSEIARNAALAHFAKRKE